MFQRIHTYSNSCVLYCYTARSIRNRRVKKREPSCNNKMSVKYIINIYIYIYIYIVIYNISFININNNNIIYYIYIAITYMYKDIY